MNTRQRDAIAWAEGLRHTLAAERAVEETLTIYPCVKCFVRLKVGYATHTMKQCGGEWRLLYGGCEHGGMEMPIGPVKEEDLKAAIEKWNEVMLAVAKAHAEGFTKSAKRVLMERAGWPGGK